ncbi:MAG: hypothetical protein R3Y29_04395 [bacterium]
MKKKAIILISCLSFTSLIGGCSEKEDKVEDVIKQELVKEEAEEEEVVLENELDKDEESFKEDEGDIEDISTDPIQIVIPSSDDTPLVEVNDYCKSIVHNLKNYHFEYIKELFISDMDLQAWEEELSKLGEFQQSVGVQTTMLTSFLLEDESSQEGEDKETYEIIVRESYLKDGVEQELRVKIILTEKLFISEVEVVVK